MWAMPDTEQDNQEKVHFFNLLGSRSNKHSIFILEKTAQIEIDITC
jgi:hypothetical protein